MLSTAAAAAAAASSAAPPAGEADRLFPVAEVPARPGMPRDISLSSIRRWYQRGVGKGIKLETRLVGGQRFTCDRWLGEFIERLNSPAIPPLSRTPTQRKRSHERAVAELAAAGI